MIRIAVIGLGFGAAVHVPALRMLPGVEVLALGGRRADKAADLACRHGIPFGGTIDEVLAARPDAVTIALPPAFGAALARRALDEGLAVLAEKPLADTAAGAAALTAASRGKTTAVGFELAELECFHGLRQAVARGASSVRAAWHTRSYAHKHGRWSWKTDRAAHGGVMSLLGAHLFYLVEWLHGPISELEARFSDHRTRAFAPPGAAPAEDQAEIRARTVSGVEVEIEVDNASGGAGLVWETKTPTGTYLLRENGGLNHLELTEADGAVVSRDATPPGTDWRIEPFRRLAQRFVRAVEARQPCEPSFASGARVQRLLEAASESARSGRRVATP